MAGSSDGKLRLEDLKIESFVTTDLPEGTLTVWAAGGGGELTTTCGCSSCDVTASGSLSPCGSACGWTSCSPPPTKNC